MGHDPVGEWPSGLGFDRTNANHHRFLLLLEKQMIGMKKNCKFCEKNQWQNLSCEESPTSTVSTSTQFLKGTFPGSPTYLHFSIYWCNLHEFRVTRFFTSRASWASCILLLARSEWIFLYEIFSKHSH